MFSLEERCLARFLSKTAILREVGSPARDPGNRTHPGAKCEGWEGNLGVMDHVGSE